MLFLYLLENNVIGDKKISLIVNMTVPKAIGYDGKTGSLVRLVEIFKHFKRLDSKMDIVLNVTEPLALYLQKNGVEAKYRILPTKLKFSGYVGLCLKAFFLMAKSFFVFNMPRAKTDTEKVVVYASSDLFWEVIPAFVYKLRNKKIEWVQIIHHIYPDWKKRPGEKINSFFGYYLQRFSMFLIRRKADKIILMNGLVLQELLRRGFTAKKMHVLSNGIDFGKLSLVKVGNISYEGVFLGRLNASKGVDDFIPIWQKVCEKMPEARLAIIGGGEEYSKAEFIRKIRESGLEKNIEVLGFLEDERAFGLLKAGKVFIFPSHEEGWGIVVAQAMACGLPVVSWDLPVYEKIFENYTVQVKENDKKLFVEKIVEILHDKELHDKLVADGQGFVKKYSWDKVAERELRIIKADILSVY